MWLENKSSQSELVLFSNDVVTVRNFNPMEPLKWGVNRVGGIKVTMPPVQSRRSFLQAVQMPTCSRLHACTYQRHHKGSHQSHRLHPCRYPRRPDEDPTAPGYIGQQVLQDRDAEDVGELDVNWGKELHEHRPYATSIIPDRLPVGKRCVDGSPSLCHHQWIRESRDRRCSVARRRRTSTGCINRRPAVVTCRLVPQR